MNNNDNKRTTIETQHQNMLTPTHQNFIALSLCLILAISSFSPIANAQCTTSCTLVWSDEFTGTSLDLGNWEYQYGDGTGYGIAGWGNNELQYYTDTQALVSNGMLTIRAEALPTGTTIGGKSYISSRIRSIYKNDTAYGRYEARLKLPQNQGTSGKGTWPAVWLLNSDPNAYGNWPASGEIDIFEWLGDDATRIYGTLHYGNAGSGSANNGGEYVLSPTETNDFHVYAVEWEPTQIRWYVDGNLYHTVNSFSWFTNGSSNPNAPFDTAFHWILNIAVGGNFPGNPDTNSIFPQELVVDYVRHYELSGTPVVDSTPDLKTFVFENFEDNDPFDWGTFPSPIGGGGIGNNVSNTPPDEGGNWAMNTGWGSGGQVGWLGGFQKVQFGDVSEMNTFSFWINPYLVSNNFGSGDVDQDFTLEINIQDDDNNDGFWDRFQDDEFQYSCRVSPTGPCAITGGGWQKIEIPMSEFVHDTSFASGGTGILDTAPGENGVMHNMTVSVITNTGADANFETDYWIFQGDPIIESPSHNVPIPPFFTLLFGGIALLAFTKNK